jgi:nucleotide-binding universal stress UspA family protein
MKAMSVWKLKTMSVKIENIFCPVDMDSEKAVDLIQPLALAAKFGAKIFFCYCAPPSSPPAVDAARRQLHRLVADALPPVGKNGALPADWEALVFASGNVAESIVVEAREQKSALIALRQFCRPPGKSTLLGSVSETILRTAPCPVLITRPAAAPPAPPSDKTVIKHILTAYDFSDCAELALQYAALLCEKYQAQLSLLHVLAAPPNAESGTTLADEIISKLYHQSVKRLQTALVAETPIVKQATAAVRWGKSYCEILRFADEQRVDLITMGAHGSDFGARSLFGSNVDRVLRQASQAVLIARPLKPSMTRALRKISCSFA